MSGENSRKKSRIDWERLREMKDDDIDTSDIPELDRKSFGKGELRMPLKECDPLSSRRLSLGHLLAQVTEDNIHKEVDTGNPQGREEC